MPETTVTVKSIIPADGKKPFKIATADGQYFATFKSEVVEPARPLVGKRAVIDYAAVEKNGYTNLYVNSVRAVEGAEQAQAAISNTTPSGDTDWDLIGLRKTRCALWAAAIGEALPGLITVWSKNQASVNEVQLSTFVGRMVRELVVKAEVDIFHRSPAEADADVPF